MKITLLQQDISWGNPEANVRNAEQAMEACPGSDVYVLPEMFSTGFCTQPEGLAEPADSDTLCWMRRYAAGHDCAVAGSVAVQEGGKYYNRFYFVSPDGAVRSYDKKHLFTYGGEHYRFTAGRERVVVEFRGVRILLQICYDLRFPVWARNRKDYDCLLYTSPSPRRGTLRGQLAYAACGSLVGLATGKSHRKPVLCGGGEPCGDGPVLRVLRRHVDDRPLRTYGSGL